MLVREVELPATGYNRAVSPESLTGAAGAQRPSCTSTDRGDA